jgi:endonuclease/exonuclease/phosphatase family metal-dependent hydrolase
MKKLNTKSKPRRTFLVIAIMLAMSICLSGVHANSAGRDRVLTVMTRNMDTGTDFGPIFSATTPLQLLTAVGAAYAEVQASNIPERAAGIAKEIEANHPDLVGLQEVTTVHTGPFGGPATTLVFDQLQSLLDELASRGLHYAPIAVLINLDAEAPAFDSSFNLFDVRVTDHDVMLARTDLQTSEFKLEEIQFQHFTTNLTFSSPTLGLLTIPRGWISVDAKLRGKQYRFVTTHLEFLSPAIQAAQAAELVNGPGNTDVPVIFAGDFNSDAESSNAAANPAYLILLSAGFVDTWKQLHPNDSGFTFPLHGEDPFTSFSTPSERIDLVLTRNGWKGIAPLNVDLIGNNQSTDLTPSGLWPSDHAGLVASFNLEP